MKQKMVKNLPLGTQIALGKYSVKDMFIIDCSSDFTVFTIGKKNPNGSYRPMFCCVGSRRVWF